MRRSCREASESQEAEEAAVEVEHGMKRGPAAMILVSGGLLAICWSLLLLAPLGERRQAMFYSAGAAQNALTLRG